MEQSLMSYFPFRNMRPSQLKVLNEIEEAIKNGYRQIVLEAATGFGKSPIAVAVARYLGSSYICTSTINLQEQYVKDFKMLNKVTGRNNFRCKIYEDIASLGKFQCSRCNTDDINKCEHITVNRAPCIDKEFKCHYKTVKSDYENIDGGYPKQFPVEFKGYMKDLERDNIGIYDDPEANSRVMGFYNWDHYETFKKPFSACEYYDQKNIGLFNNHTLLNYAIFMKFSSIRINEGGKKVSYLNSKDVLILDEGHLLENEVINHVGTDLTLNVIRRIVDDFSKFNLMEDYKTHNEWKNYLSRLIEDADKNCEKLMEERDELKMLLKHKAPQSRNRRLYELNDRIQYISKKIEKFSDIEIGLETEPDNWVIDRKGHIVSFKPVDITKYCQKLYSFGKKLLVMSATILDKEMYCKQIGLDANKIKFISIDSEFPVENRPIFKSYIGRLNKDNMSDPETHKIIASKLVSIMKMYNGVRGLIHMPNNKSIDDVLPYIKKIDKIQYIRLKVVKEMTAKERRNMIDEFERFPNSVFISPSLYTGIDLKDDLSRFQIITKVPYSNLGDKWVKKKFELDKKWYEWQTALKFTQGYGRSIRNCTDFADTYLLDEQSESILRYSFNILPESFKEAIKYGTQNPEKKTLDRITNILEVKDFR